MRLSLLKEIYAGLENISRQMGPLVRHELHLEQSSELWERVALDPRQVENARVVDTSDCGGARAF